MPPNIAQVVLDHDMEPQEPSTSSTFHTLQPIAIPDAAATAAATKTDDDAMSVISPSLLIDFATSDAYQDLVKKITKLIECPVCLEILRPGTKTVGMCEFGHVICARCYQQIVSDEAQMCPLCRSDSLNFRTCHYLATNLIEIVTDVTVFKCIHPDCTVELLGKHILSHEKHCAYKLLDCPKKMCHKQSPYFHFLSGQHPCTKKLFANPGNKKWQSILNFKHIYSVDTIHVRVSSAFRPFLLLPPADDDTTPHSKLFIGACVGTWGIWLFVSSLETEKDIPQKIKNKTFQMMVEVYTYAGKISVISKVPFVLLSEIKPMQAKMDGLHLSIHTLITFIEMANVKACNACDEPLIHMHLTLEEL
jgi:RING/Ubox like zinc-binding domain